MFSSVVSTFARTSRKSAALFSDRYLHATAASLAKLNVEGLAEKVDLKGQNVLMRVDLNVPLSKEVSFEGLPQLLWILLLSIVLLEYFYLNGLQFLSLEDYYGFLISFIRLTL